MGFQDYEVSLRARDVFISLCEGVVDRLRPEPRIAQVVSVDYWSHLAEVIFPGETDTRQIKFSQSLATRAYAGQLVRVAGKPGNYWIQEIVTGGAHLEDAALYQPRLQGGIFHNEEAGVYHGLNSFEVNASLGECIYYGRFQDVSAFTLQRAYIELNMKMDFFGITEKVYRFFWNGDVTSDQWQILLPELDSGVVSDNNFQMEIKTDTSGFHLRARITRRSNISPSNMPRGGMWVWGEVERDLFVSNNVIQLDAEPTEVFGTGGTSGPDETNGADYNKGPWYHHYQLIERRAQESLMGGTKIKIVQSGLNKNFSWDSAFRANIGKTEFTDGGYIHISMPPSGTSVALHGVSAGFAAMSTVAGGFPMNFGGTSFSILYYDPPLDGSGAITTDHTRWHLVGPNALFHVPSHWIMIATFDDRSGVPALKLGVGYEIDYWRNATLSTGWFNFGTVHAIAAYRKQNGKVEIKGLVKSGAIGSVIFTLPAEYRCTETQIFQQLANSNSTARVDIQPDGQVILVSTPGNTGYISLAGMSFIPE